MRQPDRNWLSGGNIVYFRLHSIPGPAISRIGAIHEQQPATNEPYHPKASCIPVPSFHLFAASLWDHIPGHHRWHHNVHFMHDSESGYKGGEAREGAASCVVHLKMHKVGSWPY